MTKCSGSSRLLRIAPWLRRGVCRVGPGVRTTGRSCAWYMWKERPRLFTKLRIHLSLQRVTRMFEATETRAKRAVLVVTPPCRMLALFLAIALLGTDGAYGRSIIDLTGVNHDNTDLGGSELYAKAGAYYYGDDDPIDLTAAKVNNLDLTGLEITAKSSIGLDPSRPSPSAKPASILAAIDAGRSESMAASPSIDFGSHNTVAETSQSARIEAGFADGDGRDGSRPRHPNRRMGDIPIPPGIFTELVASGSNSTVSQRLGRALGEEQRLCFESPRSCFEQKTYTGPTGEVYLPFQFCKTMPHSDLGMCLKEDVVHRT